MNKISISVLVFGLLYAGFKFFNEFGTEGTAEYEMWLVVLWMVSPFIVGFVVNRFASKNRKQQIATLSGAIVITALSSIFYYMALLNYSGDKKGLIFIAVPLYQWVVLFILFIALFLLRRKNEI